MLVLKRRAGETLMLGDSIEIRVLRVDGDSVSIGIVAPQNIAIVRAELLQEIRAETASAAAPARSAIQSLSARLNANAAIQKPEKIS